MDLFERLAEGRPVQEPTPAPAPLPTPPEALRLLDWLQQTWSKSTVCLRDIYHFGPGRGRDRESMIKD